MASPSDRDRDSDPQLTRQFLRLLHQRGYWDCLPSPAAGAALAGFNPNLSCDPETRFRILWLMGSSSRRRLLSPGERRLLESAAQELDWEQHSCGNRRTAIARLYHRLRDLPQSA